MPCFSVCVCLPGRAQNHTVYRGHYSKSLNTDESKLILDAFELQQVPASVSYKLIISNVEGIIYGYYETGFPRL